MYHGPAPAVDRAHGVDNKLAALRVANDAATHWLIWHAPWVHPHTT